MDNLSIEAGSKTPKVTLNKDTDVIELSGRSIPENAVEFYKPIYGWLDSYVQNPNAKTAVEIRLEYFNTSSSKCLLDVLKKLETLEKRNAGAVLVNWYYEEDDEDMLEAGEGYDIIISVPFKMVEVEEI